VSAVRDCLFNIFAATLLIGGRSSMRNPRTRYAVVTGTHLSPTGLAKTRRKNQSLKSQITITLKISADLSFYYKNVGSLGSYEQV
jgi:hypothetical protein